MFQQDSDPKRTSELPTYAWRLSEIVTQNKTSLNSCTAIASMIMHNNCIVIGTRAQGCIRAHRVFNISCL